MVGSCDEQQVEVLPMSRLLPMLSIPTHSSGEDDASGCSTPPFRCSASVPFMWEEEPGKPIACTTLIPYSEPTSLKKLIPPPRMSFVDSKVASAPFSTTVLDGSSLSLEEDSVERGLLGPMVMMMSSREQKSRRTKAGRKLFGSWSWSSKSGKMGMREGFGGSFVFPSTASSGYDGGRDCCSEYGGESERVDDQAKMGRLKKNRSFFNFAHVLPWKGSKLKKNGAY